MKPDNTFIEVFELAKTISEETGGAFDITVAPLVNAWGFGFKEGRMPDNKAVDSLLSIVGFQKIELKGGNIVKQDPRIMLDCSAIAKGYGCDRVAKLLRSRDIKNFMIEIGGEVVTSGISEIISTKPHIEPVIRTVPNIVLRNGISVTAS